MWVRVFRSMIACGALVDKGTDQMNRSGFLWRLGRYQEAAARPLTTPRSIAAGTAGNQEASYKTLLAWVHLTDSQMALSQLRFSDSIAKGQIALDIATTQKIKDVVCPAKYTIALAQASSGNAPSAPETLRRSGGNRERRKEPASALKCSSGSGPGLIVAKGREGGVSRRQLNRSRCSRKPGRRIPSGRPGLLPPRQIKHSAISQPPRCARHELIICWEAFKRTGGRKHTTTICADLMSRTCAIISA